ncbi:MAG: sigma factor [Lachnospiraceae bacterium]|nr:sigma factor [Lachnospiraceae bacterium]
MKEEHKIVRQIRMAQDSPDAADRFMQQYLPFIKAETTKFINRVPVEGRDDELSIAMFAFYEAMMAYRAEKGAFLRLASISIRNRLIDYYRQEQRHAGQLSLEQPASDGDENRTLLDQLDTGRDEIAEHTDHSAAKSEIQDFSRQLADFGLSLTDIAESCPRQERTLNACLQALEYARQHPELLQQLVQSRKLPLARLASGSGIERKTLERHRKYMVAILLAYTNGFEIIRGHLRQMKQKGGPTV